MLLRARSRSRSKREAGFIRVLPSREALLRAGRWCVRAGLAALAVLAVLGSLYVRDQVRRDERFFLEGWKLGLGELPGWVTPEIRGEVEAVSLGEGGGRLSLFEPGVLGRIRRALEASPWIRVVRAIDVRYPTRESPGALGIELELRRPVALVEVGGLYYLTDAEGYRLGAPYQDPPTEWFGVPAVAGVPSPGRVPGPGERWASRDVEQGLEVARVLFEGRILQEYPERPIQAIDLTNLHGRVAPRESEVVLWRGTQRLAWGRSPISAGPRTATVPQLVANLRYVLSHPETFADLAVIHLHRSPEGLTGIRG